MRKIIFQKKEYPLDCKMINDVKDRIEKISFFLKNKNFNEAKIIVDKLVSFHTPLLTEEMSNSLFELIKNIVLVVFGYQFNDKTQ